MRVKDAMTAAVVDVQPETSVWQAIRLMLAQRVSGLPVINREGRLVGMVSEGDLLRRVELGTEERQHPWFTRLLQADGAAEAYTAANSKRIGDIMSRSPVAIEKNAPMEEAVSLMELHRIRRLPVVEGGKVIGIITRADFIRALAPIIAPAYEEPATSDGEIARVIEAEMRQQSWTAGAQVTVTVAEGYVTLQGKASNEAQRTALRVLAENVNGVRAVSVDQLLCDGAAAS